MVTARAKGEWYEEEPSAAQQEAERKEAERKEGERGESGREIPMIRVLFNFLFR